MAGNIFISYRRDDAAAWAGRLHLALQKHFKKNQLFMDVDNIPAGLDFVKVLDQEVAKCDVLLAVIGKSWLSTSTSQGQRRIDDPQDFVRIEIESALARDIRVIPILVDGAPMPVAVDLPAGLVPLTRRQAFVVTHTRFGSDIDGLAQQLGSVFQAGSNWQTNWSTLQAEMARFAGQAASTKKSERAPLVTPAPGPGGIPAWLKWTAWLIGASLASAATGKVLMVEYGLGYSDPDALNGMVFMVIAAVTAFYQWQKRRKAS